MSDHHQYLKTGYLIVRPRLPPLLNSTLPLGREFSIKAFELEEITIS